MNFSELIVEETAQGREEHLTAAVERAHSDSLYLSLGERSRLPLTARIKRPRFCNAPSKLARYLFRDGG